MANRVATYNGDLPAVEVGGTIFEKGKVTDVNDTILWQYVSSRPDFITELEDRSSNRASTVVEAPPAPMIQTLQPKPEEAVVTVGEQQKLQAAVDKAAKEEAALRQKAADEAAAAKLKAAK